MQSGTARLSQHATTPTRSVETPARNGRQMTMPELVATRDVNALNQWLVEADPLEIAEELGRLPVADMAIPFRLLPKDRALEVFELLDPLHQQELLEGLRDANVRELVEDMDPDDRARLVDEMPGRWRSSSSPAYLRASGR